MRLRSPINYSWSLATVQGFFLVVSSCLAQVSLAPGIAVVLLGGIAIFTAVRADKWSLTEKVMWILVAVVLMVAEIRNIQTADRAQAEKFSEISKDLEATGRRLEVTQREIEGAAKRIEQANTGINEVSGKIDTQGKELQKRFDEQGPNAKQRIEKVEKQIANQIGDARRILGVCSSVSLPGQGGVRAQYCLSDVQRWTIEVRSYLHVILGDSYESRFDEAAYPRNLKRKRETLLDSATLSQTEIPVLETEARIDVLNQFVRELEAAKKPPEL